MPDEKRACGNCGNDPTNNPEQAKIAPHPCDLCEPIAGSPCNWRPIPEPKRDAEADLAMCEAATPGPWRYGENIDHAVMTQLDLTGATGPYTRRLVGRFALAQRDGYDYGQSLADVRFACMARTALPHWLHRAVEAEKRVAELEAALNQADAPRRVCEKCGDCNPHKVHFGGGGHCSDRRDAEVEAEAAITKALEAHTP